MPKIREITEYLESIAPLPYQEDYDNSGLLIGSSEIEITGVLVTLDVTEEVIAEAIKNNCNLIISHHPIIFRGLKKINGNNYVERCVLMAIQNHIALYAIHTNLDNISEGVNAKICEKIGLKNIRILNSKDNLLKKLVTYIPVPETNKVLEAIFKAGGGQIGNYSECSFKIEGTGSFKPNEAANPAIGQANQRELVKENKVEVIFPSYLQGKLLRALLQSHPYEEPAYDIFNLNNSFKEVGSGMIGELAEESDPKKFLIDLKKNMELKVLKHTPYLPKKIKRVAVCGGSGGFLLKIAINSGADVFITSDMKYHEYFDADNKILLADIGHYESEVFTKELIYEVLIKKFRNIALVLSRTNTNPISYL